MRPRREDIMIVFVWIILLLVAGYLILANIDSIIQASGNVVAAIISALAVFIVAILTHTLTQIREQHNKQVFEKQRNYLRLIDQMDKIARNTDISSDSFSKVHLESWVVGSPEIVQLTQCFLESGRGEERRTALTNLLAQMRSEVGLPKLDDSINLKNVFKTQEGL